MPCARKDHKAPCTVDPCQGGRDRDFHLVRQSPGLLSHRAQPMSWCHRGQPPAGTTISPRKFRGGLSHQKRHDPFGAHHPCRLQLEAMPQGKGGHLCPGHSGCRIRSPYLLSHLEHGHGIAHGLDQNSPPGQELTTFITNQLSMIPQMIIFMNMATIKPRKVPKPEVNICLSSLPAISSPAIAPSNGPTIMPRGPHDKDQQGTKHSPNGRSL